MARAGLLVAWLSAGLWFANGTANAGGISFSIGGPRGGFSFSYGGGYRPGYYAPGYGYHGYRHAPRIQFNIQTRPRVPYYAVPPVYGPIAYPRVPVYAYPPVDYAIPAYPSVGYPDPCYDYDYRARRYHRW